MNWIICSLNNLNYDDDDDDDDECDDDDDDDDDENDDDNDDNNYDDDTGKFSRVAPAGCLCIMWPCESIVKTVSLRIQYMAVDCETKTKDNVFVRVAIGGKLVWVLINQIIV